jgi:hypothetical protein
MSEKSKIDYLILRVENSKAMFERNGKKYNSAAAAKHLRLKLSRATGLFSFFSSEKVTVKRFINKIASESSTTGEKYHMILSNGKKVTTKSWLEIELKNIKNLR